MWLRNERREDCLWGSECQREIYLLAFACGFSFLDAAFKIVVENEKVWGSIGNLWLGGRIIIE
jgi:hypothetical protein